jgi:hypothetical protein
MIRPLALLDSKSLPASDFPMVKHLKSARNASPFTGGVMRNVHVVSHICLLHEYRQPCFLDPSAQTKNYIRARGVARNPDACQQAPKSDNRRVDPRRDALY